MNQGAPAGDMNPICKWIEDEDGRWETDCEQIFEIIDGTPADNDMKYCCFCGELIEQDDSKSDQGE